jgi:hypothetical protein
MNGSIFSNARCDTLVSTWDTFGSEGVSDDLDEKVNSRRLHLIWCSENWVSLLLADNRSAPEMVGRAIRFLSACVHRAKSAPLIFLNRKVHNNEQVSIQFSNWIYNCDWRAPREKRDTKSLIRRGACQNWLIIQWWFYHESILFGERGQSKLMSIRKDTVKETKLNLHAWVSSIS